MSKVCKTTSLLLAAMLFFLGICAQNYGLLITSQHPNRQSGNSDLYASSEKPELIFLNRHEERLVNSVKNQPAPSLKNHPNNTNYNSLSPEIRILSINSGYLSYSVIVDRSLTNSDIVFPFHYFW
jgi:hypothetical protein